MNSLRIDAALSRLHTHKPMVEVIQRMEAGQFPVDCAELELPLAAMLVCASSRRSAGRRYLVVVPSDGEADAFSLDCQAAGVPVLCFPWWHTAAYRPVEPRSAMFGQRAAALAAILDDNGPTGHSCKPAGCHDTGASPGCIRAWTVQGFGRRFHRCRLHSRQACCLGVPAGATGKPARGVCPARRGAGRLHAWGRTGCPYRIRV
jgi:hypothetical protein